MTTSTSTWSEEEKERLKRLKERVQDDNRKVTHNNIDIPGWGDYPDSDRTALLEALRDRLEEQGSPSWIKHHQVQVDTETDVADLLWGLKRVSPVDGLHVVSDGGSRSARYRIEEVDR